MPDTATQKKIAELEQRIKTLELIVDEKLRKKIAKGLKDEAEGKLTSLEEYEEKHCHIYGKEMDSTMKKPTCYGCYKEYKDEVEFPNG